MNWKDYPNLFANGKFEVESDHEVMSVLEYIYENYYCDFKLVARPISDLSEEELSRWNLFKLRGRITMISRLEKDARLGQIKSDDFIYLLSIGVYPFEDTTDVIFKETE